MKRFFWLLFYVFLCLNPLKVMANRSEIAVNAKTGEVVYEKNATQPRYPASLTKVMTLYMVFSALDEGIINMDDKLPVSKYAASQKRSKMWLKEGTYITLKDAIYSIILRSANDVSVVVAEALGGSEKEFAKMMNEKAKELGMNDTHFENANGLFHEDQKTTAKDLALLAYSIMHNFPEHYHFFSEKKFFFNGKTYKSNNALVLYRKDVEGMKTGYVAKSGYHTITAIKKDGEKLIVVVMGRKNPRQRDQAAINTAYKGFNIVNSRKIKPLSEDKKEVFSLKKPLLSESAANLIAFSIRNANLIAQNIINAGNTRILAEKGDWSIQIGSFKSKKSAINAARVAKESIFAEGSEGASTIVIKRGKYYASFIKYLGKEDAESACEEIKANKKPCLVIAPK